jgi:hypothetical protein
MDLTSPAFVPGESIPTKYTCDGDDISPLLRWSDPPPGTQSFVLVVDDPDASSNTWVHWVIYNLPAETRSLPEAFPSDVELPDGSRHGSNSWGRPGYGGPCPPSGERAHRYYFKLYALDIVLDLAAGATKDQVFHAARGHILAETKMKGLYARQ